MLMRKILLIIAIIAIPLIQVSAQCMLTPVLLNQRVSNSSNIIEGKVIDQFSFWDPSHSNIYTSNLVEVYKSFKNSSSAYIEVVSEGGTIGLDKEEVHPSLELNIGDIGIFTLNQNNLPSQFGKPIYEAYGSSQGFIKYNVAENEANEPFEKHVNISSTLYSKIQQLTQSAYTVVKPANPFFVQQVNSTQNVAATITSFSPSTITAGTFSVVTINGTGFGATQGTSFVEFKRADDGGATFCRPDAWSYVSWSDTQIQVRLTTTGAGTVNSTPGTGVLRVDVGGVKTTSTSSLTVTHAQINVYSNGSAPTTIYNTRHVAKQSGGYVWQMFTGFDSNAPAKASFLRAFQSWRCGTYINWTAGPTTTVNAIANDGINIIRFDVGTELPAGVLGRCTSRFSGCGAQPNQNWFVNELDIVFDDGTTWNFGPAAPTFSQYDFESVAVHELGHGHQLGHVINSAEIMNFSIGNGQSKRVLSVNDLAGGNAIMARNLTGGVCSNATMTALTASNCALGAPSANFSANKTTVCPGQTVIFTNLSTGTPTLLAWTFAGGTPSTSAVSNPTVTYNTPGTYSVQLVATNANGSSTYSVATYINVASVSSLPLVQNFQGTFLPANWYTEDSGNDNVRWSKSLSAGALTTTNSAVFDNFTTDVAGTRDELKTFVNLTGLASAKMTFYRAYGLTFSSPNIDSLEIRVGTNCGATSNQAYYKGGSQIATGNGSSTSIFIPTTAQWAKDSIDLTPYVGQNSVMISFINRSHYGDGLYIDQINITGVAATTPTAAINSASVGCTGVAITLTDASTGGPSSWLWTMTGGAPSTSTVQNTSVTYTTAGVKTITLTVANGTGTTTVTKSITITATPTVAASITNTTICRGASTNVTLTGASTYTWLPSGSGSSSVLSPTTTTIYTITGTNGGCTSAPRTVTVNVTPTPTTNVSASSLSICAGQSTTLTASGATTYAWLPGAQTTTVIAVTPTITTTYTVTGTTAGCSSNRTITVNVSSTPTVAASITNTTICRGSSVTIAVTGASVYTWLPSGSGSSSVLSPTATTIYSITGTNGSCNSTPRTVTVNVTPTPTTNISASSLNICIGQSSTLTASGATNYAWLPGAQTTTVIAVTPTITTTYTVTGTTAGCSSNRTITVNVSSTPTVAASITNTTICRGSSVTIAVTGASVYTWLPSGSGSSSVLSPTATTIYSITGSNGSCNSTPRTVTVNVTPNPVVSNTVTNVTCFGVCDGTSTITATGGTSPYVFSLIQGPTIICMATNCNSLCAGVYTLNATDANGCSNNSTFVITQPTQLVAAISSTNATCSSCTDGSASIFATGGTPSYSYSWTPLALTTPNASSLAVGCYTATVTDGNGCSAIQTTCISFGTSVAQTQNESSNLSLYPNPSNGQFTISNTLHTDKLEVTVINTLGQTVLMEAAKNTNELSFDLGKMSKGIYYAKVTTDEGTKLFKLILE